ncbi:carbon storage regulator [Zhenpiania hominis]|uniref:Translational regulator CsrA n=1 Tax=Zhenpiania hominis TaxID=2763644 RepID=A0A923NG49_9FIRM|nr:carbon storage regulator [Zhenpiania hominis]
MLILYRKKGDSIVINENITISIVETGPDGARIAIDAPRDVSILRKELIDAAEAANREAASADTRSLLKMKEILEKKTRSERT